jgi:hypothetical protein
MTGDCHVRFLESVGVRLPCATYPYQYILGSKDICVFLAYLQFWYISDILNRCSGDIFLESYNLTNGRKKNEGDSAKC